MGSEMCIRDSALNPRPAARQVSAVFGGTVIAEPPRGPKYALGPGDLMRFASSRGELRALKLGTEDIGLRFAGRVSQMSTGAGQRPRTLMPTIFDWLLADYPVSLAIAAALYVLSSVFVFMKMKRRSTWRL